MTSEHAGYVEAIKALLDCKLSGGARDFCERIESDGFSDEGEKWEIGPEEEAAGISERSKVRELCLAHGVPSS